MESIAQLDDAIKEAMKARDITRRDVLRLVKAEVMNRQIATGRELGPDDLRDVFLKEVKKRKDAIESVRGREDQYADFIRQQETELAILQEYLPKPLSEDELRALIQQVLAEAGFHSRKEMGQAMRLVMARVQGRADGKLVNRLVSEMLT